MKVRAKTRCFVEGHLREPGEEFETAKPVKSSDTLEPLEVVSKKKAPKASEPESPQE